MLEDDGIFEQADIFIEPPEYEADTDEDSGEKDGGGAPSNLNRNQLSASASVTILRGGVRSALGGVDSDEDVSLSWKYSNHFLTSMLQGVMNGAEGKLYQNVV